MNWIKKHKRLFLFVTRKVDWINGVLRSILDSFTHIEVGSGMMDKTEVFGGKPTTSSKRTD